MTPLDVRSPAGATLEQVLYAEKMFGDDNDSSHRQSDLDSNSKDGDYRDHGDDEADDDSAMDLGGKGTGGQLRKRAKAVLFHHSDDDYDHLYDDDIDEDEKRIENSDGNKRVKVGRGRVNLIPGGPNPPNCDGMTPDEAVAAKKAYSIERQKFREDRRRERLRAAKGELFDEKDYTGDVTPTLRPMVQVIDFHLKLGHTFPDRDLVVLRIAEEANYRGISFQTEKSDELKLYCRGPDGFVVYATNSDYGWTVTRCSVLERTDDAGGSPISIPHNLPRTISRSPYKVSMVVPLIAKTIAETPMASNKVLRQVLEPFGKEYCFTEAIIQGARSEARKLIFGDADDNVGYVFFVKEDLEKAGHFVELSFATRKTTMQNLDKIILADEVLRRKNAQMEGLKLEDRKAFVQNWYKEHEDMIVPRLGSSADENRLQFLNGIFFAPSFVKQTVPQLQKVFMADACHLHFGKYTLFSCYGMTANSNASPVAFAILFGNENTSTWRQFWKYCRDLHPCIDSGDITIITDQDKGQKNAIAKYLKSVGHFHCSFHRRQNIIKMCGGGGGKVPNSALWMYNKLIRCRSVALIEHYKREHFKSMKNKDIEYLNNLTNESQYPAARCAMGENIYMYHRSSSGAVESMNRANSEMRARTAVDLPNATILLLKLECARFNRMKQEAWGGNSILTPRGKEEYDATFTNLNPSHFIFHLRDEDDHWQLRVFRQNVPGRNEQVVTLPKNLVNGSYFGRCTCGADLTDAVPCEHMAAIALSSVIRPQITPMNIMPVWWKRKQWREQFPLDVYAEANITIKSVKEGRLPDFTLRLCPDWTAAKKTGRPKKGDRYRSGLEKAMAKGKPGAKRGSATKRRRCVVCGKFGHEFEGCWLLDKGNNTQEAVVRTLPIADEMGTMDDTTNDDEGRTMDDTTNDDDGKEGAV